MHCAIMSGWMLASPADVGCQSIQVDGLMQHASASDSNASSSSSEVSDAGSADKFHASDDDGSQQASPSRFRQDQADENAYASQDNDGSDNESDNGSEGPPELCSSDDEDDTLSDSTPAAHSAAAVSHESTFAKLLNDLIDSPVRWLG
jgi:hypothetical protein